MKVQRLPGKPVLLLKGDFTGSGARSCEAPLEALLKELKDLPGAIFLDLAGVPYMDSSGFSGWVNLERRVREAGRELRVRGASSLIRDLFLFADLEEVLEP
jgi:anti-anti-sigma factor